MIPSSLSGSLEKAYELTDEQIAFYQKNRFIKLKNVFDEETIAFFNQAISRQVAEMTPTLAPLENRDTYGKAFLNTYVFLTGKKKWLALLKAILKLQQKHIEKMQNLLLEKCKNTIMKITCHQVNGMASKYI